MNNFTISSYYYPKSILASALISFAAYSQAAIVTATLQGTVGFTGFGPSVGFSSGDAVTLSITYDTATPSTVNGSTTQRSYTPLNDGALLSMSLQINSSVSGIGVWNAQTTGGNFGVSKPYSFGPGSLQLTSQLNPSPFFTYDAGTPLTPYSFKLDSTEAIVGDQIDSALNAPAQYDLSKWSLVKGTLYFDNGARSAEMTFTSQVPEPSLTVLMGLGGLTLSLRRCR